MNRESPPPREGPGLGLHDHPWLEDDLLLTGQLDRLYDPWPVHQLDDHTPRAGIDRRLKRRRRVLRAEPPPRCPRLLSSGRTRHWTTRAWRACSWIPAPPHRIARCRWRPSTSPPSRPRTPRGRRTHGSPLPDSPAGRRAIRSCCATRLSTTREHSGMQWRPGLQAAPRPVAPSTPRERTCTHSLERVAQPGESIHPPCPGRKGCLLPGPLLRPPRARSAQLRLPMERATG